MADVQGARVKIVAAVRIVGTCQSLVALGRKSKVAYVGSALELT